ncbi:unnamed protein product [Moneuplotes crassus]|uniref:WW domain-containing protein n=1 Tax=Euplotes crassus TaxID=5936 RepID=A0AAD2DBK3_EUPCR|nr:unnamed protein product [Moneuplotes crassus]
MDENLVSASNKEFLEEVSPSRLQHCISELFRMMFARKEDDVALYKAFIKTKASSKNFKIKMFDPADELVDRTIADLKDREKDRQNLENDYLDELRIYDLSVIPDFWKKYAKKMLLLLMEKEEEKVIEPSRSKFDKSLVKTKVPSCFHLNYVMSQANTDCDTFPLCEEQDEDGDIPLKFMFLNNDTISQIIQNYANHKYNYHLLLSTCIQKSRVKLADQINLFSADLNNLMRKGPIGKNKKIIFKWLQSSYKENIEAYGEESGEKPQASSSITDAEKCYKLMMLQNTKISKILKDSRSTYEDRKNGIIRVPTPVPVSKPSKNSKKKKGKKKINTGIDFVMVVKGSDKKVEEIRVRDSNMKNKNEAHTPKIKDETKVSTYEDKENSPDYETKIAKYMKGLEKAYLQERNGKDLKKVKIKASARIIQKAWRFFRIRRDILKNQNFADYDQLDTSVVNKIILIQRGFRNTACRRKEAKERTEKLKTVYFGRKIFNRLKFLRKRKLSINQYTPDQSSSLLRKYSSYLPQILVLQKFITKTLKSRCLLKKLVLTYSNAKISSQTPCQNRALTATKNIETELIRRIMFLDIEISMMDKYLASAEEADAKLLQQLEGSGAMKSHGDNQLEKYLQTQPKYSGWEQVEDDNGSTVWINHKLRKKAKKHPGMKELVGELKKEILQDKDTQYMIVSERRDKFAQIKAHLLNHRHPHLRSLRLALLQDQNS